MGEFDGPIECPWCHNRFVYCVKGVCHCPICGWHSD